MQHHGACASPRPTSRRGARADRARVPGRAAVSAADRVRQLHGARATEPALLGLPRRRRCRARSHPASESRPRGTLWHRRCRRPRAARPGSSEPNKFASRWGLIVRGWHRGAARSPGPSHLWRQAPPPRASTTSHVSSTWRRAVALGSFQPALGPWTSILSRLAAPLYASACAMGSAFGALSTARPLRDEVAGSRACRR